MSANSQAVPRRKKRRIQRRGVRVAFIRPVMVQLPGGETHFGHSVLLSSGGIGVRLPLEIRKGTDVKLYICIQSRWVEITARVLYNRPVGNGSSLCTLVDCGIAFLSTTMGSQIWQLSRELSDPGGDPESASSPE